VSPPPLTPLSESHQLLAKLGVLANNETVVAMQMLVLVMGTAEYDQQDHAHEHAHPSHSGLLASTAQKQLQLQYSTVKLTFIVIINKWCLRASMTGKMLWRGIRTRRATDLN